MEGERGKKGEEKRENRDRKGTIDMREKVSEEKRDEKGEWEKENAHNCRTVFISFSGPWLIILLFVHCF